MKRVWTNASIVQCDLLKAMLESNGIASEVGNVDPARWTGLGYPMPGGAALQFAWPELWVEDADEARALEVIAAFATESDSE